MKRFLLSLLSFIPFLMVGCYESEEPVIGSLTLSQEQMTVGAEGGEYSVDITTEYTYETKIDVDWITVSGGSCGTECCTLNFIVAKNDTTSEREGVITVFCDDYNLSATLTIVQEAGSEQGSGTSIPNNEIWYTSIDGEVITPYATDVFGANIVSNTYENDKGIIKFDGDVASIGEYAFNELASLTSVTIPDSVTSIGERAFYNCRSLTSVTIGNIVTSIGYVAFAYCRSLTSVTIPDSVTSIGDCEFVGCSSLTAFYGKFASADNRCLIVDGVLNSFAPAGLTEYTIPDSVTSIGDEAFSGCSSLTSVTIPDSVTLIGEWALCDCDSLTSIAIPNSVTSIGGWAFGDCFSLTSVTIGNSVTSIGDWAFGYCSSLTSVYCKPTTPPTGDYYMFSYYDSGYKPIGCKIYVPTASVEAYKSASYWSDYASDIEGYDF